MAMVATRFGFGLDSYVSVDARDGTRSSSAEVELRARPAALLPEIADGQVLDGCLLPCAGPQLSNGAHSEIDGDRSELDVADEAEGGGARGPLLGAQLLDAVRAIREMQGSLEEQMRRRHGEILRQLEGVRAPAASRSTLLTEDTTASSGGLVMERSAESGLGAAGGGGPSGDVQVESEDFDKQPPMMSSSSLEADGAAGFAPPPVDVLVCSGHHRTAMHPSMSGSHIHGSHTMKHVQMQLQRQNTDEYTKQALNRANLRGIAEAKVSTRTYIPWHKLPQNAHEVKKKFGAKAAGRLLRWNGFDVCIGWVILLNSICIGWDINMNAQGNVSAETQTAIKVFEYAFLVIYTGELLLRFYVEGLATLRNSWVVFDCVLVVSGCGAALIRHLLQAAADPALEEAMGQVMLLRIIRLLRLVRALRLVRRFKILWRLVNGLLTSLDTMLSTLALVALVLYVASCVGVELIAGNQALNAKPELAKLIRMEYSSVPGTMLSLMQFVTMDDLSDLYKPIIREQPLTAVYFVIILMIVPIALLNLVTAVLVEGALEKSRKDHELEAITLRRRVKNFLPRARDLFLKMDDCDCGVITLADIKYKLEEEEGNEELRRNIQEMIPFESVDELFESLDIDGNGELVEQEFVDGILKCALAGHDNTEQTQILRLLRIQARKMDKVEGRLVRAISDGLGTPGRILSNDTSSSSIALTRVSAGATSEGMGFCASTSATAFAAAGRAAAANGAEPKTSMASM